MKVKTSDGRTKYLNPDRVVEVDTTNHPVEWLVTLAAPASSGNARTTSIEPSADVAEFFEMDLHAMDKAANDAANGKR